MVGGCGRKSSPSVASQAAPAAPPPSASGAAGFERVDAPEVAVDPNGSVVHVHWSAPPGTAVNEDAPFKLRWKASEGLAEAPPEMRATGRNVKDGFDVRVVPLPAAPRATLDGDFDLVVCDAVAHSICLQVRRELHLDFVVMAGGEGPTNLEVQLPEARAN